MTAVIKALEAIPLEIKALHWLCYKLVARPNGKKGKPPADPETGRNIEHNDPKHFLTFDQAVRAWRANKPGNLAGVGIRFTGEGGLVGIDLDDSLSPDGSPLPWAQEILERIDTYAEISPSGNGLHLIGRGSIPEAGGKRGNCEAYQDKRFLTVTGQVFRGRGAVKAIPPEVMTWFWKTYIRPAPEPAKPSKPLRQDNQTAGAGSSSSGLLTTPAEVISMAGHAKNADKFRRLMSGDISGYPGQSEADQALCNILAFYCGRDPALIEATFNHSELAKRDKWRDRTDYREMTIKKAIEMTPETYTPKGPAQWKTTEGGKPDQAIPPAPKNPDDWQPPVTLDNPTLPEIPPGSFPEWIESMIDAVAAATETPRELGAALALFALSTACQKIFSVRPEPGYFEQLSLYILPVMDSSNRKTTVQNPFIQPLFTRQDQLTMDASERIKATERRIKNIGAVVDGLRRQLAKPQSTKDSSKSRDKIMEEIEELESDMPEVPVIPALLVNDITSERLPVLMSENGERMGLIADEGGIFETMAGRYSKGVPNLDIFLQGYPGSYVRIDRGSRPPITLHHPALSLCIFAQTEVLSGLGDKPGFRGRGLLGRFLYFIPPSNLGYRKLQTTPIPESLKVVYSSKLTALLLKIPAEGDNGLHPHPLTFSLAALQEWKEFSRTIEATMRPGEWGETMKDYAGKIPGHAVRIAGLLHCAEHADGNPEEHPISFETMGRALGIMTTLVEHAKHAYGIIGTDPKLEDAKRVLRWIERNHLPRFTGRDVFQALKGHFKTMEPLNEALEILGERFYIGEEAHQRREGRPSRVFIVNPKTTEGGG